MPNSKQFRGWVVSMLLVLLALTSLALIRISTVSSNNTDAITRLERVEVEVNDIIDQSLLDCPNRAQARHIIRLAILNDPDTTGELRSLVESDFKEIKCDPTTTTTDVP